MDPLSFYKKQSIVTDPTPYQYLFSDISPEPHELANVTQGLIFHFLDDFIHHKITIQRLKDIDLQFVSKMLAVVLQLENLPLTFARPFTKRIIGCCREFSMLGCAILRYYNIPARVRVGFASYPFNDIYADSILLEYWHKNQWRIADLRTSPSYIAQHHMKLDFDLFDVPITKFVTAGQAWLMLREKKARIEQFCGANIQKIPLNGLWYVRDRLIQDFAALNNVEMLFWQVWGMMLERKDVENDENQLINLDYLAKLTLTPDMHFDEIRTLYENDPRLTVPNIILSCSPLGKKELHWKT